MTRPPPDAATAQGQTARLTGAAPDPTWIELSLRLPVADAELACDALAALAPGGAALEPPFRNVDPDRFGLELVAGAAVVRAYFPAPLPQAGRRAIRRRLVALPLAGALPRLRFAAVDEAGWADAWKRHFRPLRVGRLLVRPSWEEAAGAAPGTVVITLDPGRAFGTGQHATTRLCLEAIERLVRDGDTVLDVGTGSAILAIAAARLGATTVHALDTDPEALAAARENVVRNSPGDGGAALEDRIEVRAGSLGGASPPAAGWRAPPEGGYDLVVANISSAVVLELLPAAAAALVPGGHLVVSGFLREAAPRLEAAAHAAGLGEVAVTHELPAAGEVAVDADGEWSALIARAPAAGGAL